MINDKRTNCATFLVHSSTGYHKIFLFTFLSFLCLLSQFYIPSPSFLSQALRWQLWTFCSVKILSVLLFVVVFVLLHLGCFVDNNNWTNCTTFWVYNSIYRISLFTSLSLSRISFTPFFPSPGPSKGSKNTFLKPTPAGFIGFWILLGLLWIFWTSITRSYHINIE